MKQAVVSKKSIYGLFEGKHGESLDHLDRFHEMLKCLRCEGKPHLGKNVREIGSMIVYFKSELESHLREEERVLFPFLERHMPKLQSLIYLLLSEHQDFRNSLEEMKALVRRLRKNGLEASISVWKLYQRGVYFISLLRSHMWVESENLYRVADEELKPDEKRQLVQAMKEGG